MNENPEGTPNPLNPNPAPVGPAAAPAGAMGAPVTPNAPVTPSTPVAPSAPVANEPVTPTAPAPAPAPVAPTPMSAPAPTPVEQPVASEAPKKKSKTSLIVTLIIFFVVLIGAAVAALVVYNPFGWFGGSDDRVPTAIAKLFSGDAPTNVKMNGTITLTSNDETSPVSTIDVTFISESNTASAAQSANASITATFADESEFTFSADEVHTEGGDLYLRLNDVAAALEDYRATSLEATNCEGDESGETNCESTETTDGSDTLSLLETIGIFDVIDNQWIRIEGSSFSALTDIADVDSPAQCLIDAAGSLSTYNADVATAYQNNPFIEYSTENLTIGKKKDNLYLITINPSKFTNFVNGLSNSGFMNALYACTGSVASNGDIGADEVSEMLEAAPTIYVEVNEDNMFTRVYLKATSTDGGASVIADISLSYPETITITEPSEYIDLNTLLSDLFSQFFAVDVEE